MGVTGPIEEYLVMESCGALSWAPVYPAEVGCHNLSGLQRRCPPPHTHTGSWTWGRDREALVSLFPSLGPAALSCPAGRPASLPSPAQPAPAFRPEARANHPSLAPSASGQGPDPQPPMGRWRRAIWSPIGPFDLPICQCDFCHSCCLWPLPSLWPSGPLDLQLLPPGMSPPGHPP